MYAVDVKGLYKSFEKQNVLNGVSLTMDQGLIYGLTGDNGCGKSVLMKCICGLLPYDKGQVSLFGQEIRAGMRLKTPPGVLIEHPGFIESMSAYANLKYLAAIRGQIGRKEILQSLDLVGLSSAGKKPVRSFSLGMRQRLAIAQAVMESPSLLLLDEPFNGLDADARDVIRSLMMMLKVDGKTILIVSHHLQDMDDLLDMELRLSKGMVYALDKNNQTAKGSVAH